VVPAVAGNNTDEWLPVRAKAYVWMASLSCACGEKLKGLKWQVLAKWQGNGVFYGRISVYLRPTVHM